MQRVTEQPRKRARHDMSTKRNSGEHFMRLNNESVKSSWARLEKYIFASLLQEMRARGIDTTENNLLIYFNKLVTIVLAASSVPVLISKSLLQLKERMEEHDRSLKVWLSAFWKRQFERNTESDNE